MAVASQTPALDLPDQAVRQYREGMAGSLLVPSECPQVVVIGGGFGGLHVVRELKHAAVDVTLVDRHTYNTFQPLLYQVATATLNPGDVTWFLRAVRSHQKNVRFVKGAVVAMEHSSRTVRLDSGQTLSYDYLVVAAGATTNFFGIPGAEEYALPLYRRSQALVLRNRIIAALEDAAVNGQRDDMRVVVVGGGATGVETAGALAEMRNNDLPVTYPELDTDRIHVTLVEQAPSILGPFHPSLQRYAQRSLAKRGVDLRLGTAVKQVREDGVVVGDADEFLPARLVIWASGIKAHPVVGDWGLPQGRGGRIVVDDRLRVDGLEGVFAVGDVAVEEGDRALPQLAPPAIQGGKYVGQQIAAELLGQIGADRPYEQFRYRDKGTLATIGRSSAVAQIAGVPRLRGFIAWVIWIVVHLMYLLGYRNRLATMVNLSSKYLFWRSSHNAIVGETPGADEHRVRGQVPLD